MGRPSAAVPALVTVLIVLSSATVVMEVNGKDTLDVCQKIGRSMRLCGVRGVAQVIDGVVVIKEK